MHLLLKYTITKIIDQTQDIPFLNNGGCAYFAKLLAKQLNMRNISYKVVLLGHYEFDLEYLKMFKRNEFAPNHVMIKIDNVCIDGSRMIATKQIRADFDKNHRLYVNMPFKKFSKNVNSNKYWNTSFNLKKYHPIINNIITDAFKTYDKLLINTNNEDDFYFWN